MRGVDEYFKPRSLEELWKLREDWPRARLIAGGTDLVVHVKKRKIDCPKAVISLRAIPELRAIRDGGELRVGAVATLTELVQHPAVKERYRILIDAAEVIGGPQIRNVATLGGNLCNASPAADMAPPLLALDARVRLESRSGQRELPLEDFFVGPGATKLGEDEMLTEILIPAPRSRTAFLRQGRVKMDLAIVSVAAALETRDGRVENVRVAAGAVAPVPLRLRRVEASLEGSEIADERIAEARKLALEEVAPITDLRGSAEYRRHLTGVFVERALRRCLA